MTRLPGKRRLISPGRVRAVDHLSCPRRPAVRAWAQHRTLPSLDVAMIRVLCVNGFEGA